MVCDRIVVGIQDAKLSQKLQIHPELTLDKATKLVQESKAIKLQQTTIQPDDTTDVGRCSKLQILVVLWTEKQTATKTTTDTPHKATCNLYQMWPSTPLQDAIPSKRSNLP